MRDLTPNPVDHFRAEQTAAEATAALLAAHEDKDSEGLLAQRLYPVLDDAGQVVGVVTRAKLLHADPEDTTPLGELAQPAMSASPTDTLRTVANQMAKHAVTRVLVLEENGRVHSVLSLRQLLEARHIDQHEEHHRERILVVRRRTKPEIQDGRA